jgi:hypothetical protein
MNEKGATHKKRVKVRFIILKPSFFVSFICAHLCLYFDKLSTSLWFLLSFSLRASVALTSAESG